MEKFGEFVCKHKKIILIVSILLLIPSIFGYMATRVNYDILVYLPDDIETIKGENILAEDFNMGAFSVVILDNMETKDILKLEDEFRNMDNVEKVIGVADVTGKSIPLEIEEAAMIDGCNPLQTYFHIVLPILKPTAITVAILNAMWIWNDYLLPYLVIGLSTKYKTIPVVIQMLVGSNGNRDMGAMMAMLVLAIIPIIIFYLICQKHIIEGVVAGAVKG